MQLIGFGRVNGVLRGGPMQLVLQPSRSSLQHLIDTAEASLRPEAVLPRAQAALPSDMAQQSLMQAHCCTAMP
jgi:hypothetical protein